MKQSHGDWFSRGSATALPVIAAPLVAPSVARADSTDAIPPTKVTAKLAAGGDHQKSVASISTKIDSAGLPNSLGNLDVPMQALLDQGFECVGQAVKNVSVAVEGGGMHLRGCAAR
jgi:hypothetical protein